MNEAARRYRVSLIGSLITSSSPAATVTAAVQWRGKATVSSSDALCAVRRWLWTEGVLPQVGSAAAVKKIPPSRREVILSALAPAN